MTTTIKVTVYNGSVKAYFSKSVTNSELTVQESKDFVFDVLFGLVEKQRRLKALGLKKNFFGLSEFKQNTIDIDLISEDDITTLANGLSFRFSELIKLDESNRKEAFDIIFEATELMTNSKCVIDLE